MDELYVEGLRQKGCTKDRYLPADHYLRRRKRIVKDNHGSPQKSFHSIDKRDPLKENIINYSNQPYHSDRPVTSLKTLEIFQNSGSDVHLTNDESIAFINDTNDDTLFPDEIITSTVVTDKCFRSMYERESILKIPLDSLGYGRADGGTQSSLHAIKCSTSKTAKYGQRSIYGYTSASCITFPRSNKPTKKRSILGRHGSDGALPSITKPLSPNSVRFKDVEPSAADKLSQARALIESARVAKRNLSAASNHSTINLPES